MFEYIGLALIIIIALAWKPYIMKTGKLGAPYVPMEPEAVNNVMDLAEVKPGDVFYDLGSGDGRLVIAAALRGATAYGVEIDTLRVWYSRIWIAILGLSGKAKILHKNIFDVDYSDATVLNLYLLQSTNERLEEKLKKELKSGTRVVSAAFVLPGWNLVSIDPEGTQYGPLHLYDV